MEKPTSHAKFGSSGSDERDRASARRLGAHSNATMQSELRPLRRATGSPVGVEELLDFDDVPVGVSVEGVVEVVLAVLLRRFVARDPRSDQHLVSLVDTASDERDDYVVAWNSVCTRADANVGSGGNAKDPAVILIEDDLETKDLAVEADAGLEIPD